MSANPPGELRQMLSNAPGNSSGQRVNWIHSIVDDAGEGL